jgi:uncharacterized protein YodC (DUF2158 family)
MSEASLLVGQSVVLKSGGPTMTVVSLEDGQAQCTWFAGSTVKTHGFPVAGLKDAETPTKIIVEFAGSRAKSEQSEPNA